jgi:hypothetical protein
MSIDQVLPHGRLTDEQPEAWHPAKLSDRKLLELHRRLVKVRALGGAFALIEFSPQVQSRLRELLKGA